MQFGIEIEFVSPVSQEETAEGLKKLGLSVIASYENSQPSPHWKLVHDGSVDYYGDTVEQTDWGWTTEVQLGHELVSPIFEYPKDLQKVRLAMKALRDFGARVTRKCGIHIHVGCAGMTRYQKVCLAAKYAHFEKTIDKLMKPDRRASKNIFCRSLGKPSDVMMQLHFQYDQDQWSIDKDCKVGMHLAEKIESEATIEFRQHHGSLDFEAVKHWIHFVAGQVKAAKHFKPPIPYIPKKVRKGFTADRLENFLEHGCLKAKNKRFLKLIKKDKVVKTKTYRKRYMSYVLPDYLATPPKFTEDDLWKGVQKDTVTYYRNTLTVLEHIGRDKESSY